MDGVQSQQHDEFVTPQWVEMGSLHQQQNGQLVHHQSHHDFGAYGFVEQSDMNNANQFRLQTSPASVGVDYLSVPTQWSGMLPTTTAAPSYIPGATVVQLHPPALPPAQVASATLTANQTATATHAPNSSPRRTLTDADRRRMCLFHEANPNVKQTEIGGT